MSWVNKHANSLEGHNNNPNIVGYMVTLEDKYENYDYCRRLQ